MIFNAEEKIYLFFSVVLSTVLSAQAWETLFSYRCQCSCLQFG